MIKPIVASDQCHSGSYVWWWFIIIFLNTVSKHVAPSSWILIEPLMCLQTPLTIIKCFQGAWFLPVSYNLEVDFIERISDSNIYAWKVSQPILLHGPKVKCKPRVQAAELGCSTLGALAGLWGSLGCCPGLCSVQCSCFSGYQIILKPVLSPPFPFTHAWVL